MKYILTQKLISIGDDYVILDENKKKKYIVDGKVLTIGERIYLKDINGNKILKIKKKLIKLTDTYTIEKDGDVYAKLRKEMFTLIKDKFEIQTPYGEIKVKGDFIDYDYSFKLNKKEIAKVSKKFIAIRDKYVIDIKDFPDEDLILACAIIIDMICHSKENDDIEK